MVANAGRLQQLQRQLEYSVALEALEDGLEDTDLDTCAKSGDSAAGAGGATGAADTAADRASRAAAETALLLSEALRLASAQHVGSRLRSLQVAERQRLLRYLQLALSPEGQLQPLVAAGQLQGSRPTSARSSTACRKAAGTAVDAVCAACERTAAAEASWTCSGPCCRVFHIACLAASVTRRCSECTFNRCALSLPPSPEHAPRSMWLGVGD